MTPPPQRRRTTSRTRKYIDRYKHDIFFRAGLEMRGERKRNQRHPKPRILTDKKRAVCVRKYYVQNFASPSKPTTDDECEHSSPSTTEMDWSHHYHYIHGHHRQSQYDPDLNSTALPSIALEDLFACLDEREEDQ